MKTLPLLLLVVFFLTAWTFIPVLPQSSPDNQCGIPPKHIDLIQVDTGNLRAHSGILNMPAACHTFNPHGDSMADCLEDELKLVRAKPIEAIQSVWDNNSWLPSELIALRYAIELHPRVMTMSFGGADHSAEEEKLIHQASSRNILMIVAAGNIGCFTSSTPETQYPAAIKDPCLLSVESTIDGKRAPWAKRGDSALPFVPKDGAGTSSSTARMGAKAIRFFQLNPQATCAQAREFLLRTNPAPAE